MFGASANPPARLICLLLGLFTLALYQPVVHHDFINYDDQVYLTQNPHINRGLTGEGLVWAFTKVHGEATYWHPLTWVSHMLDCELFGLHAGAHHLVSVFIHAANAILLFLILRTMTGAFWRSAAVAMLFAWHPLQVDSVAWATERKNVLSTLFWMLTLWAYVRYAHETAGRSQKSEVCQYLSPSLLRALTSGRYWLALLFFALGLMCKPVLVTLPFVLLLLDFWPLRRLGLPMPKPPVKTLLGVGAEKLPFFALSAASSAITMMAHQGLGMMDPMHSLSLGLRIGNAAVSYVRYLGKTFWPTDLAVCYPHPGVWPAWKVMASLAVLLIATGFVIREIRRRPFLLVGWFWFVGVLVPTIGLVQAGSQAMADRFAYVPLIGLFVFAVWGGNDFANRARFPKVAAPLVLTVTLLGCVICTSLQLRHWQDSVTLFTHAIHVTENNAVAFNQLGLYSEDHGRLPEAISQYRAALKIRPADTDAMNNLGSALTKQGHLTEAIACYQAALKIKPGLSRTHNNWGVALADMGKLEEAVARYLEALKLKPDYAEAHYNLANALAKGGKPTQAIEHYRQALALNPILAEAHYNLGNVLSDEGKWTEALEHYFKAAQLKPDFAEAHNNLGFALAHFGKLNEAIAEYSLALRLKPGLWSARYGLGGALARQGRWDEAITHYRAILQVKPDLAEAHYQLGLALSQKREWPEAVAQFSKASQLNPENAVFFRQLAVAYAETGRFDEAMSTAEKAGELAVSAGQKELADAIQELIERFREKQPSQESPR